MLVFTLSAIFAASLLVFADPTPTAPGPNDSFSEGTNCTFAWSADSNAGSTTWKIMNVELMSGSNLDMVHLTTVATNLDGTATSIYNYPCPEVTPNSAIYFYQFTSPLSPNISWTSRFTIANADGLSTPPSEAKQPDGSAIPWGNGTLVDPSQAVPPPTRGGSNSSSSGSGFNPSNSVSGTSSTPTSSASSSAVTTSAGTSLSQQSSTTSGASSSSATTGTSNAVGLVVNTRASQSLVALGAAAFTFAVLL